MPDIKQRYSLIDAIRGFAVINMIAYHLMYDIFCVFDVWQGFPMSASAIIWERFICCTFIIVSGISINFSRHGYRRGMIVSLCGVAITVITLIFMPEQSIFYGILTFIGAAMLLTFALRNILGRIQPLIGAVISFVLFALSYGVPHRHIGFFSVPIMTLPDAPYQYRWLAFFGFPDGRFGSADYFPFIPWIFLFIFGFFLWKVLEQRGWDRFFTAKIPVLDFIGRHSLIIYMVHQPILYGICYIVFTYIVK